MKRLIIFLSLCILAVTITCSKKSTTEPDQKKDTTLTSAEIGIEGGTVGNESFLLEVPSGAFNATYQIEVSILLFLSWHGTRLILIKLIILNL